MFDISYLDLSGTLGLFATGLLSINFLLGILLSTGYKTKNYWKRLPKQISNLPIERIHNWTAYLALFFAWMHPCVLFMDQKSGFGWKHFFQPLTAPKQPILVLLGVIAFAGLLIVIISTQKFIKRKIGFRVWKNIHLIAYGTALLSFIHGLFMDPLLKDSPTDFLDAEKLFSEICMLLLVAAIYFRLSFHFQQKKLSAK